MEVWIQPVWFDFLIQLLLILFSLFSSLPLFLSERSRLWEGKVWDWRVQSLNTKTACRWERRNITTAWTSPSLANAIMLVESFRWRFLSRMCIWVLLKYCYKSIRLHHSSLQKWWVQVLKTATATPPIQTWVPFGLNPTNLCAAGRAQPVLSAPTLIRPLWDRIQVLENGISKYLIT